MNNFKRVQNSKWYLLYGFKLLCYYFSSSGDILDIIVTAICKKEEKRIL